MDKDWVKKGNKNSRGKEEESDGEGTVSPS